MKIHVIYTALLLGLPLLFSCKKDKASDTVSTTTSGDTTATITPPNDPGIAATQGFFLDDWAPKTFSVSAYNDVAKPTSVGPANVTVDVSSVISKVSPYLFGNNINPYMTQVVTENTLMNNLTNLAPGIIRAPGGSLSDLYFWNQSSQPPADVPGQLPDANGNLSSTMYWMGQNTASWTLSLDNYYQVLQTTKSTGIITINYAYARYSTSDHPDQTAAHLAANWVRYDKGRTKFWEIGNENYGSWEAGYRIDVSKNKDGQPQILTGTLYGTHFKVFADSMRKAATEIGATIKIGAVMNTTDDTGGGVDIANWNADVLNAAGTSPDFYIVHDYYTPYADNSSAATILNTPTTETKRLMTYIQGRVGAAQKPVALTEWNQQATGSNQNVSNIAGLHAAMVLGEVAQNKFGEASRWDLANGWNNGDDMGMFNIGDEPGSVVKWNPRPAFYYMYYFKRYFGDKIVSSSVSGTTDLVSYASSFTSGQAGVVLVNRSASTYVAKITFKNFIPGNRYYYYTLNGGSETTFSRKVFVNGTGPSGVSGGPDGYATISPNSSTASGGILVTVPAYGAVFLVADSK